MFKVLVIEDEVAILDNIAELLEEEGYSVLRANTGENGLRLAFDHSPDLILCDISMPGMDGYAVLQAVRTNQASLTTPFIFLTAMADRESMRSGMNLGADDYITKPYKQKEVLNAVNSKLSKKKMLDKSYEKKMDDLKISLSKSLPHELRTPLNSILGFAQLIRSSYKDIPEEELLTALDNIILSSQRLSHLINNYTTYVKLNTEDEYIDLVSIDALYPNSIIRKVSNNKAGFFNRNDDLEISFHYESPLRISIDYFVKVMEEVIDNAFKFSAHDTKVIIETYSNHLFYCIEIRNFGAYFNPEEIKSISGFKQFKRDIYEQQGSGLGLVIVGKILSIYKGEIDISSSQEGETKVILKFPIV